MEDDFRGTFCGSKRQRFWRLTDFRTLSVFSSADHVSTVCVDERVSRAVCMNTLTYVGRVVAIKAFVRPVCLALLLTRSLSISGSHKCHYEQNRL